MKTGLFITNTFLASSHFDALYRLIDSAAEAAGIRLVHAVSADLLSPISEGPAKNADFVLFWDKDIPLARRLARCGLPVFNSADAIRIADSKAETYEALCRCGIPTPKTWVAPFTYEGVGYSDLSFLKKGCECFGYPLVVKEVYGSFGAQVHLARSLAEAEELVKGFGARPFLLQEYVADAFGVDYRLNVVGERVVCAIQRHGKKGDFRSNVALGGRAEPYLPTAAQEALAVAAAKAVGADFAGVDLLLKKDGTAFVCEVNSNPHFIGTYQVTGVNLATEIFQHILSQI